MNMKNMEAQMQAAQESAVARTVALIESKAQGFVRAIKDLDEMTAERDEAMRTAGEEAVTAVARAGAKKERAALERLLLLESTLRDVAAQNAQQLTELTVRGCLGPLRFDASVWGKWEANPCLSGGDAEGCRVTERAAADRADGQRLVRLCSYELVWENGDLVRQQGLVRQRSCSLLCPGDWFMT